MIQFLLYPDSDHIIFPAGYSPVQYNGFQIWHYFISRLIAFIVLDFKKGFFVVDILEIRMGYKTDILEIRMGYKTTHIYIGKG